MQWRTVFVVTGDLPECWVRSKCDSSHSSVPLTARKVVQAEEIGATDLKYHLDLDSAVWVLPGEIIALKNCAHSNGGPTTMLDEVDVRFILLLSPFDRTQGRVGE